MKHTEISKTRGCWWKHLLLLWVAILGLAGSASAGNYPFPQNYQYKNGIIYTGSNVQSTLQSLYTSWKSNYYVESGNYARIKFVQSGESGVNSVSEGIAYGMLVFVYMDNATNSCQDEFDKLWNYYKFNSNGHGLMNWKVNAFTGQVTAPTSGNANGATDADLDAAQALLMAHKQWGSSGTINYLSEAKTLVNNIWTYEINTNKYIKPGDAFDDYKNPCYFILNALRLFDDVEAVETSWTNRDWAGVVTNSYALMKKTANSTTGLIPDWCYENGTYLSGLKDSKFESIFGYDALRIPWRMAHAYAWYGDPDAYDIANKITTWCKGKYSDPSGIVDGYQLNGTPGTGGLGGSLSSWGTSSSPAWSGGLSMGAMVNSNNSDYLKKCWERGSATDYYGAYYTHTTQLLFMLCITGNMPNFWDMLPVAKSAQTNSDGSAVLVTMSKPMALTGLSTSTTCWDVKTYATADDVTATSISVSGVTRKTDANGKYTLLQLDLTQEISEPYIKLDYNCTDKIKSEDNAYAVKFANLDVTNLITSMEPYPVARYTDVYGMAVNVQWSKEINASTLNKADFTVTVDGKAATIASIALNPEDATVVELKLAETSYLTSSTQDVKISFGGTSITSSTGTKKSKAFTNAPVQNYYMSVECYTLNDGVVDNTGLAAGWTGAVIWSGADTDPKDATNTCMSFAGTAVEYGAARCQLTSTNLSNFASAFSVLESTVNCRVYVTSNPNKEDILIKFSNYKESTSGGYYDSDERLITIPASELTANTWVDISKSYNTPASQVYDMIVIQASGQNKASGTSSLKFFFDDFSICPPAPTVEAQSGKVSYDGYQVELRFTTGMKVPSDPSAITVKEGTTTKTVSKIETKTGDASVLVVTLEEPIASGTSTVTASVASSLKSLDGRSCSEGSVTLANLLGITVATGWSDDFADATDYITLNIGGDEAGHVVIGTEDAANSLLPITYDGGEAWSCPTIVTYSPGASDSHVVMDLTGNEMAYIKYKIASGTVSKLQCRIDVKDLVNDRASDGMSWTDLATTTGWHEYSFDLSATLFNTYGTSPGKVDRTNIYQVLIYFRTGENAKYEPILPKATIQFDKISIGDALTLSDVTPNATKQTVGVAENSSIVGTSSADGYIYVVPFETTPQYSSFESAVVSGKAVKVECTADVAATIKLTGIGYGFFYAYAYDPMAGAVSTKVPITINDVTPPVITEYYNLPEISADGKMSTTVSEDATVYIFEKGKAVSTEIEIATNALYSFAVSGGVAEIKTMDAYSTKLPVGKTFQFVAVDPSGNISAVVPTAGIKVADVALTISNVTPLEATAGTSIVVTSSRPCTAYLVSSDVAVTLATVSTVALSNKTITGISGSLSTADASEGYYYVYIVSEDGKELVGPSARISIAKGASTVTALNLDVSAKTINVGEAANFSIQFDAPDAADQTLDITGMGDWATVVYDATKNSAGTGTITVTGVSSTAGAAIPITITANGVKTGDPAVQTIISLTVVQKPTSVTVAGKATMEMSGAQTLTATVLPATTDNKQVTWKSSDLSVATVDANGQVTSLTKTGTVTITATSKADATILGTFNIEVTSIAVTGLTLSPSTLSVKTNQSSEGVVKLAIAPVNATNPGVTFASSAPAVATVSYDAATNTITVNGVSVGTANITATSANGKVSNALKVTVTCGTAAPTVAEINPSQAYCNGAATATLTATFADPNTEAVWYMYDPFEEEGQTPLYTGNSYEVSVDDLLESYYVTKIENGCEGPLAVQVATTATTPPTVAISGLESSYCASSESITLKSTPSGATFTVDGVAATTLNLATLAVGNHTVIATLGTGSCVGKATKDVAISAAPDVTITVDKAMCANDGAQTLAASVAGGTWTATGSGAAGLSGSTFSPADGSAVVTYTYISGACTVVKSAEITVTDNPSPIISGLASAYCSSASAVTLAASPAGGSFTIGGTAATKFDPATLDAKSHDVVYTVEVNGCSGSATQAVTVNATPSIDLSSVPTSVCAGVVVNLAPTVGTWKGTGVTGTTFKSDAAGNYELTYSESTVAGCAASDAITIAVLKATVPTVAPITVELNAVVPALSATATGTITWYADATTTTSLGTGATYTPEVSTSTEAVYTYYVSSNVGGCESTRKAVTLTVTGCTTAAPSIAEVAAICEGEDFPTLTASGVSGATFTWYDAITGGKTLGTSATYVPTTAGTYYASQTVGCEGPRANVVVEVKETPSAPTATGASSCEGATLVAMTTTETSNWYANKNATALAEGTKTYTPNAITATTTFYVKQVVNGCASDFAEVIYTVKATPDAPVVTATEACLGSTADYVVKATASAGATLQWYDVNNAPKGTTATQAVTGVTTAKDYTYTVNQTVDGCVSEAAAATLTVNALPVPQITNALSYCSSSAASVSLTADLSGGVFTIDGATATSFVPKTLGNGTYEIGYTYTDGNKCVGVAKPQTITIETCSDPDITNITISLSELTLTVGDPAVQLNKTLTPATGTSNQEVTWISSDSKVATVDNTGKVTAVGKGTATITVSSAYTAGKSDECLVTVNEAIVPITAASFKTGTPSSVAEGGSLDFSSFVTINPAEASSPVIVWSVEGSTATKISTAGKLTAETGLTADKTITVKATITAGGVTKVASQQVTILKGVVPVNKITVICPAFMEQNKNYAAEATVEPAGADDKTFTWSIDGSGATIDNSGNITVTGAAGSTFNVIATANDASGVTGSAKVTIIAESIPVESVTFNSNPYSIYASEKLDLSNLITVSPTDATIQSTVWTITQGSAYATVSNAGVFTGITGAVSIDKTVTVKVTVTTTDGTIKSASQTITVKKDLILVKEIVIDNSLTMEAGTSKTMSIKSITSNADNKTVAWSIKSGSGATIVAGTGELSVTGKPGDSFVVVATATDAGGVVSNECVVSVVAQTIAVTKIVPSVSTVNVEAGDVTGQTITVNFQPSNTTQKDITVYANTSVFSYTENVDGSITITGIQGGTATLTVRSESNPNVLAEIIVTVSELVKNITINGPQNMMVGGVSQLSAVVGESTATDRTVTWSSSDPSVATVSATGLVTAVKGGLVTITATANDGSGISSGTNIFISTIPVESVSASNMSLEIGSSAKIKATIAPSNATYKTLTYVPEDNSIINVDADGNVSALAVGTTTVTILAPQDGVKATITVSVTPIKADKEYLIRLIDNEVWGAYAVYQKVADSTILIGWGKGRISPMVFNEFKDRWTEAQNVRYEDFATQEQVDETAEKLYKAIVAMGEKPDEDPTAIDEVAALEANVYPTNVTDHVTIEADGLVSVKVISATGKVVATEQAFGDELEINASSFAQGMYKVLVETTNGVIVKGFVK